MVDININCDVCGSKANYHSSNAIIYGKAYGTKGVWVCSNFPTCDSYVGTHPNGKPLGRLKNKKSRELSKQAHSLFDPLWKGVVSQNQKQRRSEYYKLLSNKLNIQYKDCHFAQMSDALLTQAIYYLQNDRLFN